MFSTELIMEANVEASHDILLTVLDSMDAVVYVADIQTYELLFLNKLGRDLFGDVIGKLCYKALQNNQTKPCNFCSNNKLISSNGELKGVYAWESKNTINNRWYYIRDRAIKWIDDQIVKIQIAVDITDRKVTEQKFQQGKLFSERLINSSIDGILSFDKNYCITIWNSGMEKLSGLEKKDVVGKNAFELFPF